MIIRRSQFLAILLASGFAVAGCSKKEPEKEKDDEDEEDDDKQKKKKKKKKKDKDKDEAKSATAAASATPAAPTPSPTPTAGAPDLAAILGTKADGFPPLAFAKLKENMLPADAKKVFPDMEAPSEFGIALLKKGLPAGVADYEFTFLEGKLKFASIVFTKAVSDEAFWAKLVAHLKAKLAPIEMSDLSKGGDKNVMWIGPGFHSITAGPKISLDEAGYEIQYAVI